MTVKQLISEIWRNFSRLPAIQMPCKCGRGKSRTGLPCVYCTVDELGAIVTMPTAMAYYRTVKRIRTLEDKMLEQEKK